MTYEEFKRKYLPDQWEEERIAKMTPREIGRHLAKRAIARAKKAVKVAKGRTP